MDERTHSPHPNLDPARLLEVIRLQTDIAKQGLDLGGVMDLVAHRAQDLTGATGAAVELLEDGEMVYRAVSGSAGGQLGMRLDANKSLSGHCLRIGEAVTCADSETDLRVDRDACRRIGLRSMVVVPLLHDNQALGVLKVLYDRPAAFGEGDIAVLQLLSDLIAALMHQAAKYGNDELFRRATHDGMTGLANRAFFIDRLRQALIRAERDGGKVGLLFIDMDGLKRINDELGHRAGDDALQALASRIADTARKSDTVGRLGGDEFAVLLTPLADRKGLAMAGERVEFALQKSLESQGRIIPLRASIGGALYPDDAEDADGLMEMADRAMYLVKQRGGARRAYAR